MNKARRNEIREQFLRDVQDHRMKVLKNSGIYRHLKFRSDSIVYWFEIITWPDCLTIHGDMGTFTFSRVRDMFTFFRDDQLRINPPYWSEKLQGAPRTMPDRASTEFSKALFEKRLMECAEESELTPTEIERLRDEVLSATMDPDTDEREAVRMTMDWQADDGHHPFQDFWEVSCRQHTIHFLWCCYAIVWAIQQYDQLQDRIKNSISEAPEETEGDAR